MSRKRFWWWGNARGRSTVSMFTSSNKRRRRCHRRAVIPYYFGSLMGEGGILKCRIKIDAQLLEGGRRWTTYGSTRRARSQKKPHRGISGRCVLPLACFSPRPTSSSLLIFRGFLSDLSLTHFETTFGTACLPKIIAILLSHCVTFGHKNVVLFFKYFN